MVTRAELEFGLRTRAGRLDALDLRMATLVVSGPGMAELSAAVAAELGGPPVRAAVDRFPDGELHVSVPAAVAGGEVVLLQSFTAPAGEQLLELALLADACRRAAASRVSAVIPYFAYARQDHSTQAGEALGGAVMARLVSAAGFARVIAVDLHSEAVAAWLGAPVEHLSAMTALAQAARPSLPRDAVVVSPDLGGAKRAERVARFLGLPLAIVHKSRHSGTEVAVHRVLGDVRERPVLIVDDMISTGGTIAAAVSALRAEGCAPEVTVLATHALLAGDALERLRASGVRRLFHTDSVPLPREFPFEHQLVSLAPLLATALRS